MCGIAGIWQLDSKKLQAEKLQRFTDALNHRGPDGSGYHIFNEAGLGLGHRRLSILDLSIAGKQPMHSNNGRFHLSFNGEIFNFIELRKVLATFGYTFHTETDTEVILAAYEKWGLNAFDRFNGMWAIALYDSKNEELLLCRDRFGVKPLYYTFNAGKIFAFASETIAFKNLDDFNLAPDESMFLRAIENPVYPEGSGRSIWKNINQLLAGHYIVFKKTDKQIKQHRWFKITSKRSTISYEEACESFFAILKDAVNIRLRSDVPVACALSGGLDSSSVYAMMFYLKEHLEKSQRTNYNNIKGFVATFKGTLQDETDYARSVVEHCQGEAEFIETDFTAIVNDIVSSTKLFNDISGTPISVLGTVYKSMRENNYLVSLDGHGVDEMLYGYRSLVGMAITQEVIYQNEEGTQDLVETYLNMFHPEFYQEEKEKLEARIKNLRRLNSRSAIGAIKKTVKGILGTIYKQPEYFDFSALSQLWAQGDAISQLSDKPIDLSDYTIAEKELAIDFYYRNIPYNMRDFDRAAMQHGVEIRMPFMDYRLVDFVFSLPTKYKVGHGFSKRILRDSVGKLLPETVRKRKLKIGMGAPINVWFNNHLNEYLLDTVNSGNFLQSALWDGRKLGEIVTENCRTKKWSMDDAQKFWSVLNAHIILQ